MSRERPDEITEKLHSLQTVRVKELAELRSLIDCNESEILFPLGHCHV
jgi:hypothetical protein